MNNQFAASEIAFRSAKAILVGGVNSPVRAFKGVGGDPLFFDQASGAYLMSVDSVRYIDFVMSWGAILLGHADCAVEHAVVDAIKKGTSFGAPTRLETNLANEIQSRYPSMEKIRFVNSGTEAGMSVIRLARGFTKKQKIIKFSGCYHGHADPLLVSAGSGGLTLGVPDSDGVSPDVVKDTISLPYNNVDALRQTVMQFPSDIAAIIMEPITGNMGVIAPSDLFLKEIQSARQSTGALLIFDEVMCGFRVHDYGAQGLLDVSPDLTMLGKVIGGGLPCGAYGGRADIMACVSPEGGVYQAGTLSGNPVVMSAGLAAIQKIKSGDLINSVATHTTNFCNELRGALTDHHVSVSQVGSMFSLFFRKELPQSLEDVQQSDTERFKQFFHKLIQRKIYFPPSPYEACFTSASHDLGIYQTALSHIIDIIRTL
jgi:glutamate-1-semialdehyde 2,1-aminomutase